MICVNSANAVEHVATPAIAAPKPLRQTARMIDTLESPDDRSHSSRRQFALDDTGFDEVPEKFRKFYRRWLGATDVLGPNEVLCPVCKVVIRSHRELRPGDRVYCMPCMSQLLVARGETWQLVGHPLYASGGTET